MTGVQYFTYITFIPGTKKSDGDSVTIKSSAANRWFYCQYEGDLV